MRPGILVGALLSGEGPCRFDAYQSEAGYLCALCETGTGEAPRPDDDGRWVHASCAQDSDATPGR